MNPSSSIFDKKHVQFDEGNFSLSIDDTSITNTDRTSSHRGRTWGLKQNNLSLREIPRNEEEQRTINRLSLSPRNFSHLNSYPSPIDGLVIPIAQLKIKDEIKREEKEADTHVSDRQLPVKFTSLIERSSQPFFEILHDGITYSYSPEFFEGELTSYTRAAKEDLINLYQYLNDQLEHFHRQEKLGFDLGAEKKRLWSEISNLFRQGLLVFAAPAPIVSKFSDKGLKKRLTPIERIAETRLFPIDAMTPLIKILGPYIVDFVYFVIEEENEKTGKTGVFLREDSLATQIYTAFIESQFPRIFSTHDGLISQFIEKLKRKHSPKSQSYFGTIIDAKYDNELKSEISQRALEQVQQDISNFAEDLIKSIILECERYSTREFRQVQRKIFELLQRNLNSFSAQNAVSLNDPYKDKEQLKLMLLSPFFLRAICPKLVAIGTEQKLGRSGVIVSKVVNLVINQVTMVNDPSFEFTIALGSRLRKVLLSFASWLISTKESSVHKA